MEEEESSYEPNSQQKSIYRLGHRFLLIEHPVLNIWNGLKLI